MSLLITSQKYNNINITDKYCNKYTDVSINARPKTTPAFSPDQLSFSALREKYNIIGDYVICPGALIASKGPQNVVKASVEYSDLAQTIFIGAGEIQEELEKELGERGKFLGFVSAEDKAKLINGIKIF